MGDPVQISSNGKRRIYRVLCSLAASDQDVHPKERAKLQQFADRLGIGSGEASKLEREACSGKGLEIGPSRAERMLMVDGMCEIAAADGRLAEEELTRIHAVARLVGISAETVERRLEEFARGEAMPLSQLQDFALTWKECAPGLVCLALAGKPLQIVSAERSHTIHSSGGESEKSSASEPQETMDLDRFTRLSRAGLFEEFTLVDGIYSNRTTVSGTGGPPGAEVYYSDTVVVTIDPRALLVTVCKVSHFDLST